MAGDFVSPFASTCLVGGIARSCIAGEGAAVNTLIGTPGVPDTAIQHLDWIVIHTPGFGAAGIGDDYLYRYQLENSSIAALGGHTVATPDAGIPFFAGSAFVSAGDLDLANLMTSTPHASPVGALPPGQAAGPFVNLLAPRTTTACTRGVDCNGVLA